MSAASLSSDLFAHRAPIMADSASEPYGCRPEDGQTSSLRNSTGTSSNYNHNYNHQRRRKRTRPSTTASANNEMLRHKDAHNEHMLDLDGPKLSAGIANWLTFYQLIGHLNFLDKPLWMSIIFKLLILALMFYTLIVRFALKLIQLQIINENYRNPIFLFITFMAVTASLVQVVVTLYVNLFSLCPMFKVLTTPKLCFVKRSVQNMLGNNNVGLTLAFLLYQGLLMRMLASRDLDAFIAEFYLPSFVWDLYFYTVGLYYIVGMSHVELYIRLCFGHWLLGLKSHLEMQFSYVHERQRAHRGRSARSIQSGASNWSTRSLRSSSASTLRLQQPKQLITMDEIQRHLNNMDDHLEVLRSVQVATLVLISLNAFLSNGSLFLITYQLLANQKNFYHGFILFLLSINYIVIIFLCYLGDRFVYYALSSFVQSIEDEYFTQQEQSMSDLDVTDCPAEPEGERRGGRLASEDWSSASEELDNEEPLEAGESAANRALGRRHLPLELVTSQLLIKRKDVLFCREFLNQFENHLATPWSKLTFKSHLHMLRTFVTLIAAQIIFDYEH